MADYIRREEAMEIVKRTSGDYAAAFVEIRRLPAADVKPTVHGRWIDKTVWYGEFGQVQTVCSECGTIYPHKPGSRGDGKGGKFCEECGANMDGGKENV